MSPTDPNLAKALTLADEIAAQMFARFGERVPLDVLASLAQTAAVDAARRWDGRGQFVRFAVQLIRWRVLGAVARMYRLSPNADTQGLRTTAGLAAERAAEGAAVEMAAENGPRSIEEIEETGARSDAEPPAHAHIARPAFQDMLGRAAACFAVDLDAAGVRRLPDPQVDVEGEVDRLRVRRAVEALPPNQRAVVERHGYRGETFEEIAAALGEERSTVFSRFMSGLSILQRTLGAPPRGAAP